jgi:hypothetical protein
MQIKCALAYPSTVTLAELKFETLSLQAMQAFGSFGFLGSSQ